MATIDKNQSVIDYLLTCPQIASSSLFFNAINAKDTNKQLITMTDYRRNETQYIDGSVSKIFTIDIVDFKSVNYQSIVKIPGSQYKHENVEDVLDTQGIIDWIIEQDGKHNYPDFGPDCVIDKIYTLSENPGLDGIDTSVNPGLAKYNITIKIEYIDYSNVVWK